MGFPSFSEWLDAQEDGSSNRAKMAMAMGLGPDLPLASLNSGATVSPLLLDLLIKKGVDIGQKKKKHKKKKKNKVDESRAAKPFTHELDQWFDKADELKELIKNLKLSFVPNKSKEPIKSDNKQDKKQIVQDKVKNPDNEEQKKQEKSISADKQPEKFDKDKKIIVKKSGISDKEDNIDRDEE